MAPTDWRPPWPLKFVAFLFILVGVLGVTDMLLKFFVFGGIHLDFVAILALLIGRGLLRWREGWRKSAVFFTWLFLLGTGVMSVTSSLGILFRGKWGTEVGIGSWRVGAWLVPVIGAALSGIAIWMLRVLGRPDVVWHFKNRMLALQLGNIEQGTWNPLRWRFSLGSMFLATAVIAFVLARVTADDILYEETHHLKNARGSGRQVHGVEYGVRTSRFFDRPEELLYVVLSTDNSWRGHVNQPHGPRPHDAWVQTPDGTERVFLSPACQLYEIVDGKLRTRDERVTKAELDDFIEKQPAEWSLDALVKRAEAVRKRQAK